MRKEEIFEAFGDIDEQYIQAAHATVKKRKCPMWVKITAAAACLCLTLGATMYALNQNMPWAPHFDVKTNYGNTTAYVGWTDNPALYEGALNRETLASAQGDHLPIFKMDTVDELAQFRATYENILSFDQGYGTALSFDDAVAKAQWNTEAFYNGYTMLAVYVPASDGSLQFVVESVNTEGASICISIGRKNEPEISIDEKVGWFVLIEVEDEEISKYTSFDAVLKGD